MMQMASSSLAVGGVSWGQWRKAGLRAYSAAAMAPKEQARGRTTTSWVQRNTKPAPWPHASFTYV